MNPFSAIFGMVARLRNSFYDRGILKSRSLTRPVISIGNLSVGGSGKTPFVILLGRLLKERGIEFDVLSRGYGRASKEIAIVDANGSAEQFGDEPLLITCRLGVPVVVGADRYRAGLLAEEKLSDSRLHLLDDGFQHRRLHRDFDIVLISDEDLRDTLLPIGRLREPFSSLRRADAVVLADASSIAAPTQTVWRVRRNISFSGSMNRVVAFCGIARPEQFFRGLRKLGMDLADTVAFPDHHRYTQSDIDRLLQVQARTGATGFAATEKDEINLGPLAAALRNLEIARLELELENPQAVVESVLGALGQRLKQQAESAPGTDGRYHR